jgi:hypothetical protein
MESSNKSNSSPGRFKRQRLKFYKNLNINNRSIQVIEFIVEVIFWLFKNILTLATAGAALLTIYFAVLQPAKIEIQAGSFIAITPEYREIDKSRYILGIPVSFYNDGAKPGILARVGLVIKDPNNMYAYFFKSNNAVVLREEKGKQLWQLESAFSPIIVPPRNAISKTLRFETSGFNFDSNKTYRFCILAWDKESYNPTYRKEFEFAFESDNINSVENTRQKQKQLLLQRQNNLQQQKKSSSKNSMILEDQEENTITPPENGKYGPITGAIDNRTYQSLTGSK